MPFKRVPALTVGALIALSPIAGAVVSAAPAYALTAEEQAFVDAINASRAAAGLAPLTVSEELSALADLHSAKMASTGTIFHSSDLGSKVGSVYANWTRAGENVGMGSSVQSIHQAMLASPSHAANIYGDYNLLGVGVYTNPGGIMFVTEIFAKAVVESSTAPAPAPTVTEPVPAPAPTVAPTTTDVVGGTASSASKGSSSAGVKTRTVKARKASGAAAHRSAMGAARNAAHSGGRRGAPEWARNGK